METLHLKSKEDAAKVTGALVCFGGALLISLYKGKNLHLWPAIIKESIENSNKTAGTHHLRGTLLLFGDCVSYAFWYPIQVCLCFWINIDISFFPSNKTIISLALNYGC